MVHVPGVQCWLGGVVGMLGDSTVIDLNNYSNNVFFLQLKYDLKKNTKIAYM